MPRARSRGGATTGVPSLPLQRTPRAAVLVLLRVTESMTAVVRRGSEAAHDAHLPLEIVVLTPDGTASAACMTTMDEAVQLARNVAPEVEIRVETSSLDQHAPDAGRRSRHPLVVATPETWGAFNDEGDRRLLRAQTVEVL